MHGVEGLKVKFMGAYDMLGLNEGFKPKFLRQFAHLGEAVKTAVGEYVTAVKDCSFPSQEESY